MPRLGKFKTSYDNAQYFVDFLQDTLIPDLIASGHYATAHDFAEAVYWLAWAGEVETSVRGLPDCEEK